MIRGDFLNMTEEELNKVYLAEGDHRIKGLPYEIVASYDEIDLHYSSHDYFRADCLSDGFHLTHLYPIYYQGWECDQWGAIGTKDGQLYRLETSCGPLYPTPIKKLPEVKLIKSLFFEEE